MPAFKDFRGINNVDAAEDLDRKDLRAATNVDIDNKGKVRRRGGSTEVYSGVDCHSLWGEGNDGYLVEDGNLKAFNSLDNTTSVLRANVQRFAPMAFKRVLDTTYFTNGVEKGMIVDGVVLPWGVELPSRIPDVALIGGSMFPGAYMLTLTFVADDGSESGAIEAYKFDALTPFSISLTNIPTPVDASVAKVRLYLTKANGETFYRVDEVVAGVTSRTLSAVSGSVPLRTYMVTPPPAGTIIDAYNGRMLVVDGRYVYFSDPFAYSWFRTHKNYWRFAQDVTICGAVADGIYVVADKTYFMAYDTPLEARIVEKAEYGAIKGTMVIIDAAKVDSDLSGQALLWTSTEGVCFGGAGGTFKNLTQERYQMPGFQDAGAAFFREVNGMSQYLSLSKRNASEENNRVYAADSAVAEVVRNGVLIT